ncbi:hypothetical protein [Pedobacter panaciterrae]
MAELLICYDFKFNLDVKKRNGKTYKRHLIMGMGFNYEAAVWDVYFKLKKEKAKSSASTASRFAGWFLRRQVDNRYWLS